MGRSAPRRQGPSAAVQLRAFIAKFAPADQHVIRSVRAAVRRRFPTAHELVYDNYNFFVIGYSPTERPSDAIVSIAARANALGLCFIHGARLPDPARRLSGAGRQSRFVRLASAATLREPAIEALLKAAVRQSAVPLPRGGRGKLIVRAVSVRQRPRRQPVR